MKTRKQISLLIVCSFLFFGLFSQSSFFESLPLDEENPVEFNLTVDFKTIIKKKENEQYYKANLSTRLSGAVDSVNWAVKVKTRGNMRKNICYFPPLKLNLKKSDLEHIGLNSALDKYKLVLQCFGNQNSINYLIKEYLAYRIYETVTPNCFRVKPIKVNVLDTENGEVLYHLAGLIIESEEEVAHRLAGKIVDRTNASFNIMDRESRLVMAMFQYLIGNTDWYAGNLHNLKLIKLPEIARVVPLPYDFDYSGLVAAHYAVPNKLVPIKSVLERYYLGASCTESELEEVSRLFFDRKEVIFSTIKDCPLINDKLKSVTLKYIERFYTTLENPKKAARAFSVEEPK